MPEVRAVIVSGLLCSLLLQQASAQQSTTREHRAPVGLALEVDNGAGVPLKVKAGQTFYINQIDLRAALTASSDEGVDGLDRSGDFATLDWQGVRKEDQEFVLAANPDGTFRRRRFFRDARWMNAASSFTLEQVDRNGRVLGAAVTVTAGDEDHRRESDDFFVRRIRALQWTNDCRALNDCSGATAFEEEALVELRHALHRQRVFRISPRASALRLRWSQRPSAPYSIPLQQIASPPFAYGFSIDVETLTTPRPDGTYAPGSEITFRLTLRDGAGTRLHPQGSLPTYNEVINGPNPAGIQYFRSFFDPTTTYWRRKHRERMLMAEFIGPAQHAQPIRSIIDIDKFLGEDDVQVTGRLARDGMHAEFRTFPTARDLFGGAFDPTHAGWSAPVPDTWTHKVPHDAPNGTYYLNVKGRRTYLGEDIPFTRTLEIQVGTATRTHARLRTGPCTTCHTGQSALGKVLHANDDRATCAGCHVPLGFELEGPIYVRTHFIHSRTNRLGAPLTQCSSCHLTAASIERTSKSACLSCHESYPQSHVRDFGPIESMYVGGGRESFERCSSACHRTHPGSRL